MYPLFFVLFNLFSCRKIIKNTNFFKWCYLSRSAKNTPFLPHFKYLDRLFFGYECSCFYYLIEYFLSEFKASTVEKKIKTLTFAECVLFVAFLLQKNNFSKVFSGFFCFLFCPELKYFCIFTHFFITITKYKYLLFL